MANTDKHLAEQMDLIGRRGDFPENSVFDPSAEARGEPIIRKLTAQERKDAPVAETPDKADKAE